MSIARFFTIPCTITTPSSDPDDATTDDDGVPLVTEDETETLCHVQPYTGREGEQTLGADIAERARRVWFPAGTDLRYTSTVTIGGDEFSVHGDPDTWTVGSASDHVDAVLIRSLNPSRAGSA